MNIKMLKRLQRIITKRESEFDMVSWFGKSQIPCGTTACIAGWTLTLHGCKKKKKPNPLKTYNSMPSLVGIQCRAADVLQLDFDQSNRLFYSYNWPQKFYISYYDTINLKERAQIASNRIQHFIDTNGAE